MRILASFDTRRLGSATARDLPGPGKAAQRLRKSHQRGQYSRNCGAESWNWAAAAGLAFSVQIKGVQNGLGQGEGLGSGSRGQLLPPPPPSFAGAGLLATQHRSCGSAGKSHFLGYLLFGVVVCLSASPPCLGAVSGEEGAVSGWQSIGAASPPAATAASLLNYINRPPSSVIFYYVGKKRRAGQVKIRVFARWTAASAAPTRVATARF